MKSNVGKEHSGTGTVQRDLYGMMTGWWVAKEGDKGFGTRVFDCQLQADLAPSGTARRDKDETSRSQG